MSKALYVLHFDAGEGQTATLSFLGDFDPEHDKEGIWSPPYPNTIEDSYVFGLLESWGQADASISPIAGAVQNLMFGYGDPTLVEVNLDPVVRLSE